MAVLKSETNPADRSISYYPDGWASMQPVDSTLSRMHKGVQNGQWKTDIDRLRERVADKNAKGEDGKLTAAAKAYKKRKAKLAYFTAGGKFKPGSGGRKKEQFHDSTGIRFLELDGETTAAAAALRDSLRELPVRCCRVGIIVGYGRAHIRATGPPDGWGCRRPCQLASTRRGHRT